MHTLPGRILCLVTDLERAGGEPELLNAVQEAVRGGVNMVQVRAHELDEDALASLAIRIVEIAGDEALVVANSSADVASRSGVHGVHLRESSDMSGAKLPRGMLRGQSAHSLEAAQQAEAAGADYIILGTIFPSASHPGGETGGIALVESVTSKMTVPVICIGGITEENAASVIAAGASGVAVIGAIIGSANPLAAARGLATAIKVPVRR